MPTKFVVVLGSLMSGLGKGIVTSSILRILDFYGYNVLPLKFDGYLNYDCGTMNPYRHGEVFVFDDKSEVDMDFGMYERFSGKNLTGDLSITGGKVFSEIIARERRGAYLGIDVQIVPHLTDLIVKKIEGVAKKRNLDVMVIEVGGTVGDIENGYFIEAMRQLAIKEKVVFIDVTYIPMLSAVGEQKTKPTQLALRSIMQSGIRPDFVVCRTESALNNETREKLAMFANLPKSRIIEDCTQDTLYSLPPYFMDQKFDRLLINELGLEKRKLNAKALKEWKDSVANITTPKSSVNIAIVGKYTKMKDAYASVKEALVHSGADISCGINLKWVESEDLEKEDVAKVLNVDGIIVPGGFGNRGIEGKINAIRYARENKIPYLGLCLGMQLMAIEYARNVCGLDGANSTEFNKNARHKIVDIMPSQLKVKLKGASMRLGSWKCKITSKNTIAYEAYGSKLVQERHRHRYEVNNKYRDTLQKNGAVISGVTPDNKLVEFFEWKGSFGIGTQAHPELKSKFGQPAPLFLSFVKAAREYRGAK
ncbi:MAG TPA: CTP synthase [Candidatus Acidoferrales bacterium]|nr:CTP synthase [Candidatus Acidoferrales bacterium]